MFEICQDMKQLVRYDMLSDDCRSLPYNVTVVIWNYKNKTELNFGFGRVAAIFLIIGNIKNKCDGILVFQNYLFGLMFVSI